MEIELACNKAEIKAIKNRVFVKLDITMEELINQLDMDSILDVMGTQDIQDYIDWKKRTSGDKFDEQV